MPRGASPASSSASACQLVEKSGLGPFDGVRVTLEETGGIEVVTGAASLGQGIETVIAQICADALAHHQAIRVVHGQTDRIRDGMGAFASRATVMTGTASHMAATALRAQLVEVAAPLLQRNATAVAVENGVFAETGARAAPRSRSPKSPVPRLHSATPRRCRRSRAYDVSHMCYPYGIHAALVRVDRETGGVAVERLFIAYDIGRSINPMLVAGQLAGGAAQGIGGALLEDFTYDAAGQPLAASFADYLMPTAHEMPPVEMLVAEDAPSPLNPLGVKGAGEGGITAVGAAIANAIDDALGRPGGKVIDRLPLTPARVRAAIRKLGL